MACGLGLGAWGLERLGVGCFENSIELFREMDKIEKEMQEMIKTLADLERRVGIYAAEKTLLGAQIENMLNKSSKKN